KAVVVAGASIAVPADTPQRKRLDGILDIKQSPVIRIAGSGAGACRSQAILTCGAVSGNINRRVKARPNTLSMHRMISQIGDGNQPAVRQLLLEGEVPLLRIGRLHMRYPTAEAAAKLREGVVRWE